MGFIITDEYDEERERERFWPILIIMFEPDFQKFLSTMKIII